jgi:hypothetical protein
MRTKDFDRRFCLAGWDAEVDKRPGELMIHRILAPLACMAVAVCLASTTRAAVISYTLGNQDFADGAIVAGGLAQFNAASADDPAPFDQIIGNDFGSPLSANWTFNYPATPAVDATITLGIVDHDSQATGNQVASFLLEGNDLTALLNAKFEASGGAQVEANVYSVTIPAAAWGALADGSATFSLALQGPGLQDGGLETTSNGAGLDFARLQFIPVPEPSGLLLLSVAGAVLTMLRRPIRSRRDQPTGTQL